MPVTFLGVATMLLAAPCTTVPTGSPVPIDFVAYRYFARWPLHRGGTLYFYLDTGGGPNTLYPGAVQRLRLVPDTEVANADTSTWVRIARDLGSDSLPAIPGGDGATIRLYAPPPVGQLQWLLDGFAMDGLVVDGMLGPTWFADRVWTFDYPRRRLSYHGTDSLGSIPSQCWVAVGFQQDSAGQRTTNFPRITTVIDGDSVDFLFDTGAMTTLTDSARREADPQEPQHRATSFITQQRFDQWHERHPDWPVVRNAERGTGAAMIRVPEIAVGSVHLGPVSGSPRGPTQTSINSCHNGWTAGSTARWADPRGGTSRWCSTTRGLAWRSCSRTPAEQPWGSAYRDAAAVDRITRWWGMSSVKATWAQNWVPMMQS